MLRSKILEEFPNYKLFEDGTLINISTGKIKEPCKTDTGYMVYNLWKENKSKMRKQHILLAKYFIPNPNNYNCINHINGNKTDNTLNNLEWTTRSKNNKHAYDTGLKKPNYKKVNQYDLNMNFIRQFNSIKEANEFVGGGRVCECCKKTHLTCKGYYWRYA